MSKYFYFSLLVLLSCSSVSKEELNLNGIYVLRNYNPSYPFLGSRNSDTLILCDGFFVDEYYGCGEYYLEKYGFFAGQICIKHGSKSGSGKYPSATWFRVENGLFTDVRLVINSDLNCYFERISPDCLISN